MKLIIEPDDGIAPLLSLIRDAKERVDMTVFRFERRDLEKALRLAIEKGVKVNALIAYSNHGGEKSLRKLEMRFLDVGVTVARTASDLVRYHNKLIIIDQRILCVLSFNFTHMDIDRSRGFGIVTDNSKLASEAGKLLDADSKRIPYTSGMDTFVVSPANARKIIGKFIKGSKEQLLIYDPKISDREMIRILKDRVKAGVAVRVIGKTEAGLAVRQLRNLRLHTRTIIRDGKQAFIGSQSLRANELDSRREVGLIFRDAKIIKKLMEVFESDWESSLEQKDRIDNAKDTEPDKGDTEKAIQVLVKELNPIAVTVKNALEQVVVQTGKEVLEEGKVKETVKKVVKKVVKQAVEEAVAR